MIKTTLLSLLLVCLIACSSKNEKTAPQAQFTDEQAQLIMAADSATPMRVFKITKESDSLLLRTPSEAVTVDPKDTVLMNLCLLYTSPSPRD